MQEYQINNSEIGQTVSDITDLPPLKTYVTDTVQPVIVVNPSGIAQDVNIDSITAGVSIPVTVTATKKTTTFVASSRTTTGTTTIGTVGAGKVWRIISINGSLASAGAITPTASILGNSVALMSLSVTATATGQGNVSNAISWNYEVCPVLTAGQTLQLTIDQNALIIANIVYVEESA